MRLALTAAFILSATVAATEPRGMRGDYPLPKVVRMSGPETAYVIARGQLTAAAHQVIDGSFDLMTMSAQPAASCVLPRGAVAMLRVRELDRRDVELVLRTVPQRTLEKVSR